MNETQRKAIDLLSRAFKKCKKANLCFQGMDATFLVFDADEYRKLTKTTSLCDQQYVENDNQGEFIDTHGTYMDSGGW